jgi:hypothetical protein
MYIAGIMSLYGGIHTVLEVAVSKLYNAVGVAEWLFKSHAGFHGFLVIVVMINLVFLGNKDENLNYNCTTRRQLSSKLNKHCKTMRK